MATDPAQIDFSKLARYRFLSFVREGVASALTVVDNLGGPGGTPLAARARFTVSLTVQDLDGTEPASAPVTSPELAVLGPGDVIGLNQAHLVRSDPHPNVTDAEFSYFPLVEFSRPDLPWLFTPAAADPQGRLRPWVCLVVVRQQDGVTFAADPGRPLPALTVASPAVPDQELPDLADCWLWAHAQVLGHAFDPGLSDAQRQAQMDADLAADSPLNLSRLICPRRLQPETTYVACLVPTFQVGRKAGLGEEVTAADQASLAAAWSRGATAVTVPVYHSFTFTTGGAADFETLARQLVPRAVAPDFGTRPMDVSHPGSALPELPASSPDAVVPMEGALVAPGFASPQWPRSSATDLPSRLAAELNASARLQGRSAGAGGAQGTGELTVGPPIYGRWQAAVNTVPGPPAPPWLSQLNLDPRRRVSSGLGTAMVIADEEPLMASAWAQVGEVVTANRALRLAQVARSALAVMHGRHLSGARSDDLLGISAPAQSRLLAQPGATVSALAARSTLTAAGAGTGMRRVSRLRGPMLARAAGSAALTTSAPVQKMAAGRLQPAAAYAAPNGTLGLATPSQVLGSAAAGRVAGVVNPSQPATPEALDRLVVALNRAGAAVVPITADTIRRAPPAPDFHLLKAIGDIAAGRIARVPPSVILASRVPSGPVVTAPAPGDQPAAAAGEPPAARAGAIDLAVVQRALSRLAAAEAFDPAARARLPADSPVRVAVDTTDAASLRVAEAAVADGFVQRSDGVQPAARATLSLDPLRASILHGLGPEATTLSRMRMRIGGLDLAGRGVVDPLQGIMAAPSFPRPMYEVLRDHAQEFLVPGLDAVPPDTITLVQTNPTFEEAFLVGLNHEMSRKLLWRQYPTDQRGTYFRQFWPTAQPEIPAIPAFSATALGTHIAGGSTPQLVLLVRGLLLRRFPGAFVYATRDDGGATPQLLDTGIVLPIFRGSLNPDVTIVGFPFTASDALANPPGQGDLWIVIAQQPTEPRFGLEEGTDLGPDDVSWSDLLTDAPAAARLTHAPASAPGVAARVIAGQRWGVSGAAQAHICFKEPFRVALRAKDVLPSLS